MVGSELNSVSLSEKIGRRVFDSNDVKNATRAERPRVNRSVFKPPSGKNKLSTDRLDHASYQDMKGIVERTDNRSDRFKGWVFLVVEDVSKDGRNVTCSPTTENPYHADIELPSPVADSKEDEIDHAQALADIAKWYYPSNNADTLTLDEASDSTPLPE